MGWGGMGLGQVGWGVMGRKSMGEEGCSGVRVVGLERGKEMVKE